MITGDESWIYEYDPETKRQNEEWKHCVRLAPKKRVRVVQKSKSYFFSILEELPIANLINKFGK